jgi:putative ABC transport system permease protein
MQWKWLRNVRLGIKNLMLHKLRSLLTMLGVVCGVGSVVAMLSIGEGNSRQALDQIRKLGSNNIILESVKPVDEVSSGGQRANLSMYGLTYEDEQRLRMTLPSVRRVVPAKTVRREGRLNDTTMELRVVGTTADWFDLVQRPLLAGRVLTPGDQSEYKDVVVLTETGARKLLATEASIGQRLRIASNSYEVVGIVRNESGGAGGSQKLPDREVDAYIPINLARERYTDIDVQRTSGGFTRERVELHTIIIEAASTPTVEPLGDAIQAMLTKFHKKRDYQVQIPLELLRQAEEQQRIWNWTLGSIAGISLLVGGIGIMNIMLASVTERTREIGVRRAIGAKRRQIISQFLIETTMLSAAGGLLGTLMGPAIAEVIEYYSRMPTIVPAYSIILSVGISLLVGIVFGLYPAIRAANLDPIVALRHE